MKMRFLPREVGKVPRTVEESIGDNDVPTPLSLTAEEREVLKRAWEALRRFVQMIDNKYKEGDNLDAASHLGRRFGEEDVREKMLTQEDATRSGANVLASWDFSKGRFVHQGMAGAARGILTAPFKETDPNTGHLRLNVFGRSQLVLPFKIQALPQRGIRLKLRHLAASRLYFAYQGSAQFSVLLDGNAIAKTVTVSHHGSREDMDTFWIGREYFFPGQHEFTILLSGESTTTYWIFEVQIEAL